MSNVLFEIRDAEFVPTEYARGPWSPDSLHGGPVAALLARALECAPAAGTMHPARLTVELLRPVPLAPLSVQVEELRPGRKVQWLEATLTAAGTPVALARMLRIRAADVPVPAELSGTGVLPFAGPADAALLEAPWRVGGIVAFHSHATEHRAARGSWHEPGPISDWIRLRVDVVAGESPSPLQRVAAVADFGNG
ncbi:MAG: thioesterase family protein, partial [Alphaproteobacteria bacterium]